MWDVNPSLFADEVAKVASKRVVDVSTDMLTGLVEKMPVDTTRAVSNIKVSINEPDYSVDESKYVGRSGAMAEGMGVINSIGQREIPTVYLQDNLYYVKYLEWGRSGRSPNGIFYPVFMAVSAFYR